MKVDFKKAYDCVDWGFLRMVLLKVGLNSGMIEWIMGCVVLVSYAVIFNGLPTNSFDAGRCLRQGCALSPPPLLFILVMEKLSLKIRKGVSTGDFEALKISKHISVSHSFFVDDILLMGMINKEK